MNQIITLALRTEAVIFRYLSAVAKEHSASKLERCTAQHRNFACYSYVSNLSFAKNEH